MLYDTHAHLNDGAFAADAEEVFQRAVDSGVRLMNIVGCDPASSFEAVRFGDLHKEIRAVAGVHPSDSESYSDEFEQQLKVWAREKRICAIGEIGLDYHYDDDVPHGKQQEIFRRQLRLASELDLPVVIHCRDAMDDTVRIIREEMPGKGFRGVFHCFSGSWEQAQICLKLGFYLGFDGPLTFKNSKKLPKIVELMPADRILVETDCPYMSPEPLRGRRNEPAHVFHIVAKVAALRGITVEEAEELTFQNGCRLFGIDR